jgi:hypothetical protein
MKYVCKVLQSDTPATEIESKLNQVADHGWECVSMALRPPDLLFLFRGNFSNLGDFEIALNFLNSFK